VTLLVCEKCYINKVYLLTYLLADNWKWFKQRFNIYLAASGAGGEDEKMKARLLLHVMGEDALDIYNSVQLEANLT